jgi:hypothetical protein
MNSHIIEFQQWEEAHNNDSGSESNPSEDELTPTERKEKVMSEVMTNRQYATKKKKKKKKKAAPVEKPTTSDVVTKPQPNK